MIHPDDDQLLLLAYGELPVARLPAVEAHLRECADCGARFRRLEESRIALDWGLERGPVHRAPRALWLALPLAAGIGALLLVHQHNGSGRVEREAWKSHLVASPTAGYVTGGAAFMAIDSQLTRLEQERHHGSLRN